MLSLGNHALPQHLLSTAMNTRGLCFLQTSGYPKDVPAGFHGHFASHIGTADGTMLINRPETLTTSLWSVSIDLSRPHREEGGKATKVSYWRPFSPCAPLPLPTKTLKGKTHSRPRRDTKNLCTKVNKNEDIETS